MVNLFQNMKNCWQGIEKVSVLKTHIIIFNLNILFTSSPNFIIILLLLVFMWKLLIIFSLKSLTILALKTVCRRVYLFLLPQAPVQYGLAWHRLPCVLNLSTGSPLRYWSSSTLFLIAGSSSCRCYPSVTPSMFGGQLRPVGKTLPSSAMEGLDVYLRTIGLIVVNALEKLCDNHHSSDLEIIFQTHI